MKSTVYRFFGNNSRVGQAYSKFYSKDMLRFLSACTIKDETISLALVVSDLPTSFKGLKVQIGKKRLKWWPGTKLTNSKKYKYILKMEKNKKHDWKRLWEDYSWIRDTDLFLYRENNKKEFVIAISIGHEHCGIYFDFANLFTNDELKAHGFFPQYNEKYTDYVPVLGALWG